MFFFSQGDLKEFLEEYMSSNSSCFVLSERHSKEDNHKRYSSRGAVSRHSKQIKIKKKKQIKINRLSPESGNRKKVDMQRLSPRFRSQQFFLWKICEETFSPNLQRFVWRRHAGAHLDGHQHGGRKPAETSITEFCYKSVNLSLEELKNVTMILYSNARTVQIVEFPETSHFLNQHHSSLARGVNATSRKSLKIQAQSISKPRTHSE